MTATITTTGPTDTAIGQLMHKFTQGDSSMLTHVADDIDFKIEHYKDDLDTSWQSASSIEGLMEVLGRLSAEVFPKGTLALAIDTSSLGDGWHLTRFNQQFFYGERQCEVTSVTHIISHEFDGKVDYFRENVTNVIDV
ncbi:hypothetical protein [Pseudosulfitobacter sp. DSM 107133]|uniref:hypothetical protein n=1 Tax=Pseudosulfitobacter sp. DSM 107133 TaxID=2883100 RepID=UPI000DF324A2|nr:hypothetical protein [Pseudosulfitobacter sp. DSM 107133]UOA29750.1 hypothetical protein DSM107133_04512 [Pseudosulfitobacter sp. DSM 107133]